MEGNGRYVSRRRFGGGITSWGEKPTTRLQKEIQRIEMQMFILSRNPKNNLDALSQRLEVLKARAREEAEASTQTLIDAPEEAPEDAPKDAPN